MDTQHLLENGDLTFIKRFAGATFRGKHYTVGMWDHNYTVAHKKNTKIIFFHIFYNTWLICSVLEKLATMYDKIFQLHLNNVAALPCKVLK